MDNIEELKEVINTLSKEELIQMIQKLLLNMQKNFNMMRKGKKKYLKNLNNHKSV